MTTRRRARAAPAGAFRNHAQNAGPSPVPAALASASAAVGVTPPPDPARLAEDIDAWRGVSVGLVAGFVEWLLGEGYALASINRRLATVRAYLTQAAAAGAPPPNSASPSAAVHACGAARRTRALAIACCCA